MSAPRPGDVADVTFRPDGARVAETMRGIRWTYGWIVSGDDGYEIIHDRVVEQLLPLWLTIPRNFVAIDPDDREQVGRLLDLYFAKFDSGGSAAVVMEQMQAALREFANPPKCEAVVILQGEHFRCDLDASHSLPAHSNKEAQAIWGKS